MVCGPYTGDAFFFPPSIDDKCVLPSRFFTAVPIQLWSGHHWNVPIMCASAYILFLLYFPVGKSPRIGPRTVFVWNGILAVFSILGSVVTVSSLVTKIVRDGIVGSICDDTRWFGTDAMGVALVAFVFSKPIELIDTVVLKLRHKPIIFLHWYHHLSVMFYTWHAFVTRTSMGPWFATVNYTVHAIMYSYYALTQIVGIRHRITLIAPFVTILQISQMFVGMSIALLAMATDDCNDSQVNTRLALGMYLSYAILFVAFFQRRQHTRLNKVTITPIKNE